MSDDESFAKARDLAKAAMNRAQAAADQGTQRELVNMWTFVSDGWCRIAELYRDRT